MSHDVSGPLKKRELATLEGSIGFQKSFSPSQGDFPANTVTRILPECMI